MRSVARAFAGLASVLVGIGLCVFVQAATGGPDVPSVVLAFGFLLAGLLGLGVLRTGSAPWRPVRASLAWASLVAAYLLLSLPLPSGGAEVGSAVVLATLLLAAAATAALLTRRPVAAAGLLLVGAAYGLVVMVRFATFLGSTPGVPKGPAITLGYTLAATLGAAWLAALWHGRTLLRARRGRAGVRAA